MQQREIPGVSKKVPRLVLGTAHFPFPRSRFAVWKKPADEALLDEAFELGFTAFDTAAVYGQGATETMLGRWMKSRKVRDRVVLIGKGAHPDTSGRARVTPGDIASDLNDSLRRLETDFIDIYLLHRDDPTQPVGPLMQALHQEIKRGRIGAIGASNWTHARIAEANDYATAQGLTPFAVSSPQFGLATPSEEPWHGCVSIGGDAGEGARRWYSEKKMAVLAWSSLGGGFFSGRFRRDNLGSFESYSDQLCVRCYCNPTNFSRLERAQALAKDKGLTPAQIALAWVLQTPLQPLAIVSSSSVSNLRFNRDAERVLLTPAEHAWLETGIR